MNDDKLLLIGLGAQRAGTTWLATYFYEHPEIFIPLIKELHFFDRSISYVDAADADRIMLRSLLVMCAKIDKAGARKLNKDDAQRILEMAHRVKMIADPDHYIRYLLAESGARRTMCEITPDYSDLDSAAFETMAKIHSRVRFFFVMRNPIDRIYSQVRYSFSGITLEQALEHPHFIRRSNYARTLTELLAVVPRERVFIEFYERLFTDSALARLCEFAEIRHVRADMGRRIHSARDGQPLSHVERRRAFNVLAPVFSFVDDLFQGDVPPEWRTDVERFGL